MPFEKALAKTVPFDNYLLKNLNAMVLKERIVAVSLFGKYNVKLKIKQGKIYQIAECNVVYNDL